MKKPEELNLKRALIEKETSALVRKLKKRPPPGINDEIRELDEQVFTKIDCTTCANCCKTISPVFKDRDIDRLASYFKVKPGTFTEKYLFLDKDGDYVLQSSPCPFLGADNFCSVYEHRPAACRNYPHTGSLPATKSWNLIIKNSAVCPAVYEIMQQLSIKYNK